MRRRENVLDSRSYSSNLDARGAYSLRLAPEDDRRASRRSVGFFLRAACTDQALGSCGLGSLLVPWRWDGSQPAARAEWGCGGTYRIDNFPDRPRAGAGRERRAADASSNAARRSTRMQGRLEARRELGNGAVARTAKGSVRVDDAKGSSRTSGCSQASVTIVPTPEATSTVRSL